MSNNLLAQPPSRVLHITQRFEHLILQQQQQQQQQPTLPLPSAPSPQQQQSSENEYEDCILDSDMVRSSGVRRSPAFRVSANPPQKSANGAGGTKATLVTTASIKEALRKPLPKGPPPAKPPRSFEATENGPKVRRISAELEPRYHPVVSVAEATKCGRTLENGFSHYEEVNQLFDVAFLGGNRDSAGSGTERDLHSVSRSVSERHRKRLKRVSVNAGTNRYTRQYGTIRTLATDAGGDVPDGKPNAKGLIHHYNAISASTQQTTPAKSPPAVSEQKIASKVNGHPVPGADKLYEYCILVGYDILNRKPYTKTCFPSSDAANVAANIELLVFPCESLLAHDRYQEYRIILTDHRRRMYGFCRRVLPESSDVCLPLTYCIVSTHDEPQFFFSLLRYIEGQHGTAGYVAETLIRQFYSQTLPQAGESFHLQLPLNSDGDNGLTVTINRPKDLRLERTELYDVFQCLGPDLLIFVFECLLLERTVILYSNNLTLLSASVHALQLLLYPFRWQHILITIIPDSMQQILDAPVPMLAGCMTTTAVAADALGSTEIEEGIFVSLDTRDVHPARKEKLSLLPQSLRRSLRVSLEIVQLVQESKGLTSVLISEAFVRFFAELLATLDIQTYQKQSFLAQVDNASTKLFLDCFLDTAMFGDFLESNGAADHGGILAQQHYALYNAKLVEKSSTKYWHTASIDEVLVNCKLIAKKDKKPFLERVKRLLKK